MGDRGQIVIPQEARRFYGISPGDTLLILGNEASGLAVTRPEILNNLADEIFGKRGTQDMKMESMYEQLGVSTAVYEYGERIIAELWDRFDAIDQTAEYNQAKVIAAMQKNRVNATHFAATTGYGYDDEAGTIWNGSMPMYSTRKLRWCGLRSPAAPTPDRGAVRQPAGRDELSPARRTLRHAGRSSASGRANAL